MARLLQEYLDSKPEIIFEWNDSETDARGWVVINSLRNGAAGGGTRMRRGLTQDEVVALAKVMEIKFSVSGPPIGGAKSGIDFDPDDPRKNEVLGRWFNAVFPLLKNYYGTGGDLNIDELKDVIPITEELGLWHPQEGVVSGHYEYSKGKKVHSLGQLRYGVSKIIENKKYTPDISSKLAVADMVTGYGVSESILHFYSLFNSEDVKGKRVIIQGWGNVAASAAFYLAQAGAKIIGIIDKAGGIISEEGLSFEEVSNLYLQKKGNSLYSNEMISFQKVNEKIWDVKADVFVPGAASRLVTRDQMNRLINNGLEVVSCGANVPFIDDKVFFGPTAEYVDNKISLIPDFIANCGMARTFAYLMSEGREISDENIFKDVSVTIYEGLNEIKKQKKQGKNKLMQSGMKIALKKLV